jgi:NhaC family Na+:H+ antiporter
VIICSIISIATGSSWTTSATVGIALIGVGGALGFDLGMVAGAVFLAPISEINYHQTQLTLPWLELICLPIRYMTLTTIPTYVIQ